VFCVTILLLGMCVSIPPRATTCRLLDSSFFLLPPSTRDEAMASAFHSSTMACSGDNKNYEYLEQGFGLVITIIVPAKYLAGIYRSPPLPLVSLSPTLLNLNSAPSTSITSLDLISARTAGARIQPGHRQRNVDYCYETHVGTVFSSPSGLLRRVAHIYHIQPPHLNRDGQIEPAVTNVRQQGSVRIQYPRSTSKTLIMSKIIDYLASEHIH
jgi:hypothetical protein